MSGTPRQQARISFTWPWPAASRAKTRANNGAAKNFEPIVVNGGPFGGVDEAGEQGTAERADEDVATVGADDGGDEGAA